MVLFKNIVFDANWIEADAEVRTTDTPDYFHVRINRDIEQEQIMYSPNTGDTHHLKMACWNLLIEVNSNKVKQQSELSIVWG